VPHRSAGRPGLEVPFLPKSFVIPVRGPSQAFLTPADKLAGLDLKCSPSLLYSSRRGSVDL